MAFYENEIFRITKHGGHVANDETDVGLNDISQVCMLYLYWMYESIMYIICFSGMYDVRPL